MMPLNATPPGRGSKIPDPLSGFDNEPDNEPYYDSDELTMMAFFDRMRTYKVQSEHYSPAVFTARLDADHVFHVAGTTDSDESNVLPIIEEESEDDIDIDDAQDPLVKSTTEKTCNLGDLARAPGYELLPSAQAPNSHSLRTRVISTDATVSRARARPNQTIRSPSHAAGDHVPPVATKSTTKRSNVSPGIKPHSPLSITKKGGSVPRVIPSVPAAATPSNSSQTPVKSASAAPVYASRKPTFTGVSRPTASSLSKVPSMEMPKASKITTVSNVAHPPSCFTTTSVASRLPRPVGLVTPSSWCTETMTKDGGSKGSTILKPTVPSAPLMEMPKAPKTSTAFKVARPPSRFATVAAMAYGLLRFPGSLLHSCRLPVPASSALHSTKLPNTGGGPNMNRKNDSIGGVQGIFQNGTIGAYAHKIRVSLHLVSRYLRIPWLIPT